MTEPSTTIRVSHRQRERLRGLATMRGRTLAATLDDALEALRRQEFFAGMAAAEQELRADPEAWVEYVTERDAWLEPDLAGR